MNLKTTTRAGGQTIKETIIRKTGARANKNVDQMSTPMVSRFAGPVEARKVNVFLPHIQPKQQEGKITPQMQ
jgi:hypothetical protein